MCSKHWNITARVQAEPPRLDGITAEEAFERKAHLGTRNTNSERTSALQVVKFPQKDGVLVLVRSNLKHAIRISPSQSLPCKGLGSLLPRDAYLRSQFQHLNGMRIHDGSKSAA